MSCCLTLIGFIENHRTSQRDGLEFLKFHTLKLGDCALAAIRLIIKKEVLSSTVILNSFDCAIGYHPGNLVLWIGPSAALCSLVAANLGARSG
jgi:hypothetical protein